MSHSVFRRFPRLVLAVSAVALSLILCPVAEAAEAAAKAGVQTKSGEASLGKAEAKGKAETDKPAEAQSACACEGPPGFSVFLDFGARYDLGNFTQNSQIGQNPDNQSDDVRSWGPQMHLGLLSRLDDRWRLGGSFGYLFNYDTNNNNSLLGQLLTLDIRLEWTAPISGKWWILLGPKVGLSSILPGGVLQDQIEIDQGRGYSTLSGPRLGFLVGADAGVRYVAGDWLAIRGTLGYLYSMNFLINSGASAAGIDASRTWMTATSRLSFMFGPEVSF